MRLVYKSAGQPAEHYRAQVSIHVSSDVACSLVADIAQLAVLQTCRIDSEFQMLYLTGIHSSCLMHRNIRSDTVTACVWAYQYAGPHVCRGLIPVCQDLALTHASLEVLLQAHRVVH